MFDGHMVLYDRGTAENNAMMNCNGVAADVCRWLNSNDIALAMSQVVQLPTRVVDSNRLAAGKSRTPCESIVTIE